MGTNEVVLYMSPALQNVYTRSFTALFCGVFIHCFVVEGVHVVFTALVNGVCTC